ncbi:LysR family transcriptional regulator [Variovorax sp. KK3]|uniref:LysR family transcriptional regulator n=1 Tax=Variovorax sp. KK3 TaxID=1855728 RepID=UPI00097CA0C2|nr:LysR family transcriptional regulator [Variovorax sp. KK3]
MDIRSVDLNLLPVLDALLRHRSATLAARELNMSQSALSTALGRLRALLGDELFVRTGRGFRPTARASELAEPVAEIIERVSDRILQSSSFDPKTARADFRIAHSDVGAYVLWPRVVRAVRARAPGVQLALKTLQQDEIAPALAEGQVDLAVGSYPGLPDSLFQQRLFERVYVALMAATHPLAKKTVTLRSFAASPQVVVRAASGVQDRIDQVLSQQGLARPRCVELPSYLMIPPLLEAGDFLAVVPGQLADAFSRHGGFVSRKLPFTVPASVIRMHWHRRFNDDAANRWLRALMVEEFGAEPDSAKGRLPKVAPRTPG